MHARRFDPSAMLPVGSGLWVAERSGTAWVLVEGDPPSTAAVVDVGMVIAPSGPRSSSSLVASPEGLWAAVEWGVLIRSFDGAEQRLVDLGAAAGPVAASGDGIWAVLARSTLVRIAPDGLEVGRMDVGSPILAIVAGREGAWVVTADDVLLGIPPSLAGIAHRVLLEGWCGGIGLGDADVVVAFATNRLSQRGIMGGLARVDRSTGELRGVVARDGLCSGLVVAGREAWVADGLADLGAVADEDGHASEPTSVVDRIDLETGETVATIEVAGQIMDLAGDASRLWALAFSRAAQATQVLAIDPVSGSTTARVDFREIDLSGVPEPPPPSFDPCGAEQVRERLPPPESAQEAEERIRAAADEGVHSMVQCWDGGTDELLPPWPFIAGFEFDAVRLRGEHPATRLQFLFRSEDHTECRFGWETELWRAEGLAAWNDTCDDQGPTPDPEAAAAGILIALQEDLLTAGYGLPDDCDPDEEGITWVRSPYGGKPSWEWDLRDRMEWALRQYRRHRRPVSRERVQALLDDGVGSIADVAAIVTGDRRGDRPAALWLLHELGDTSAVAPLLARLADAGTSVRIESAESLRMLARPGHEPQLLAAFASEPAPAVRAALMDALAPVGGPAVQALALRLLGDSRQPVAVRAAAARTLGVTSVGQPEVVATLAVTLNGRNADLVVAAASALAVCCRARAPELLEHLQRDRRQTSGGETVGALVGEELEQLVRWRR